LKIVVANNDPLAKEVYVPLEKLVMTPGILPATKSFARNIIDEKLRSQELEATASLETNNLETLRSMTSAGLGWSCLPDFYIDNTLAVLDIPDITLQYSVAVIHRRDTTLTRAAQKFLDSLRETH